MSEVITSALYRVKNGLLSFHRDERGPELVEQVLTVALVALPALFVLYFVLCQFCGVVISGLDALGIDAWRITETLGKICIFGPCD